MNELGEITRCYTIRYERRSAHGVAELWNAITDPEAVTRWMAYPARIDLRVGGDYHVDFSRTEAGELDGVIIRVEPEQRLAYVWGMSVLEWTLEPDGTACRYSFVHHGQKPGLVPDEAGIAAGWHVWLDDLEGHLCGEPPGASDDSEAYQTMLPGYRKRVEEALHSGAGGSRGARSA